MTSQTLSPECCPACHVQLAANAVLCIECGFDLRTGNQRTVNREPERELPQTPLIEMGPIMGRIFRPLHIVAFATLVALLLIPIVYWTVAIVAGVCGIVGGGWLLLIAYDEQPLCFVLMLFVPFYGLYYLVTRWDGSPPFILGAGSITASITLCLATGINYLVFGN